MYIKLLLTFFFCLLVSNVPALEQKMLSDKADRINYSIGYQIGTDFKNQKVKWNEQKLKRGLQEGYSNTAPILKQKDMELALLKLKKKITSKLKEDSIAKINERKKDEEQKRSEGLTFMQNNKNKQGVKSMANGMQYKTIIEGSGVKPGADDHVTFNYRAKTLRGREYDSSYKKGEPSTYRVNGVIPGFTEAIQMMQTGSKWELYIPPELAYGRQGPLAHQTIILEVELLAISH